MECVYTLLFFVLQVVVFLKILGVVGEHLNIFLDKKSPFLVPKIDDFRADLRSEHDIYVRKKTLIISGVRSHFTPPPCHFTPPLFSPDLE